MLKSSGSEGRGVVAKVADFGLSVRMDHMETHMSGVFQGTLTHMVSVGQSQACRSVVSRCSAIVVLYYVLALLCLSCLCVKVKGDMSMSMR